MIVKRVKKRKSIKFPILKIRNCIKLMGLMEFFKKLDGRCLFLLKIESYV